jgi:hypothetical protein
LHQALAYIASKPRTPGDFAGALILDELDLVSLDLFVGNPEADSK